MKRVTYDQPYLYHAVLWAANLQLLARSSNFSGIAGLVCLDCFQLAHTKNFLLLGNSTSSHDIFQEILPQVALRIPMSNTVTPLARWAG